MKTILKTITLLATVLLLCSSCRSSDDDSQNNQIPSASPGFTWRENDPNATAKSAGSSEVRVTYKSIFAFAGTDATSGTLFEINLTGVAAATYDLATTGNSFYFSGFGSATSGKVIITKNDGSKASGTFEAFTTTGTITKVYGTFTDIAVK